MLYDYQAENKELFCLVFCASEAKDIDFKIQSSLRMCAINGKKH